MPVSIWTTLTHSWDAVAIRYIKDKKKRTKCPNSGIDLPRAMKAGCFRTRSNKPTLKTSVYHFQELASSAMRHESSSQVNECPRMQDLQMLTDDPYRSFLAPVPCQDSLETGLPLLGEGYHEVVSRVRCC